MKKGTKLLKKFVTLLLVVLMSIDSFAAVIDSNDGGAFVTKEEFEELKQGFSAQADRYNASIDNKIDGAIASYLAGLSIAKRRYVRPVLSGDIYSFDNSSATSRFRYVYGPPALKGKIDAVRWSNDSTYGNTAMYSIVIPNSHHNQSTWWQTKLLISDIDESKKIAAWQGRYTHAFDELDVSYAYFNMNDIDWGAPHQYLQLTHDTANTRVGKNIDFYGYQLFYAFTTPTLNEYSATIVMIYSNSISNVWGRRHNENIFLFGNSVSYDCFSNKDDNRNWRYDGTSEDLKKTLTSDGQDLPYITNGLFTSGSILSGTYANAHTNTNRVVVGNKKALSIGVSSASYNCTTRTNGWKSGHVWYYPGIGFEKSYITNWNQLYNPNLDAFAKQMADDGIKGYDKLMVDANGNYHVPIYAGLPLILVKNEEQVELEFNVKNSSLNTAASNSNYGVETKSNPSRTYIWAKTSPFTTNDPNSEADLVITTGNGVYKNTNSAYNKGVYINTSTAKLRFDDINENHCIWLKWSTNNKNGGGVVTIPNRIVLITSSS